MKKKALVVDNTSYIRADIRELLEEQGYEVYEAGDGLEAFEIYKKIKPDIVTMDINMPKVHGLKATQLITDFDPKARVMICSTMITFQNYIKMAKEAGAKSFLSKPFSDEEFFDELAKLFLV
ncbi:MAG: response regulator [Leptotrichiaceae bacterium]|nr:response regulator [Leptotrichiaceae bacterium]MBP6281598.1 response regulator [Leptotrichiaceae bacterium]MBP7100058.1 response regulator [Leptotrichiaceae bacterium]MBP7725206.1 response regulator [Leptotrichiaceae bacterium]MBP9629889.1 response regulator [Leptotrichiaceae bacterium]